MLSLNQKQKTIAGCLLLVSALWIFRSAQAQQSEERDPLPEPTTKAELDIRAHFCDVAPQQEICSVLPKDVTDFSASSVYMLIEQNAQNPFDLFSWKTFVALTWPLDQEGTVLTDHEGGSFGSPRLWQTYSNLKTLFDEPDSGICDQDKNGEPVLITSEFTQAQGQPLIDQNGNYVVFDVRVNPTMEKYIRQNNLNTLEGQQAFKDSGKEIDFPKGHYDDAATRMGGKVGSLEIKTAWRILDPDNHEEMARFMVVDGNIEVAAADSIAGDDLCIPVKLGLVGFHIVRRTESGNGGDWVWTTFEHIDNAPYADKARGPNSIFSKPLFPQGCAVNVDHNRTYSFFDPDCANCKDNLAPVNIGGWKWWSRPPYAGPDARPAQVTRCWKPSLGTRWINRAWQEKLTGTAWQYYALSTTQWKGANKGQMFPHGEVPRYLTNATMETYIQTAENGSCLGCHAEARTRAGQPANFSFVLSRVPVQ
ncbi:MAG: hypothetical protein ACR2QW_19875 [bacterium]